MHHDGVYERTIMANLSAGSQPIRSKLPANRKACFGSQSELENLKCCTPNHLLTKTLIPLRYIQGNPFTFVILHSGHFQFHTHLHLVCINPYSITFHSGHLPNHLHINIYSNTYFESHHLAKRQSDCCCRSISCLTVICILLVY